MPTIRQVVIYTSYFAAIFAASLLAMVGATWVSMSWSHDGSVAHGARIVLGLVISIAVLNAMYGDKAPIHAENDPQLG